MKTESKDKKPDRSASKRGVHSTEARFPVEYQTTAAVLVARGKKRLEMILNSSDPAALVTRLPEREVFLTIKEVGERNAMDLIILTTPDQLTHILDLELWKKDVINVDRAILWFEILQGCGEKKLVQFFKTVDAELLICLFRKLIRVLKVESAEEEPTGKHGQSLFTLDRVYYLEFLDKRVKVTLTRILDFLCSRNLRLYQGLMESVLWDVPGENEALALRWRNGRLADRGFPDFDEALEVYSYVPPERVRGRRFEILPALDQPSYPPTWVDVVGEGSFFSRVLRQGMNQTMIERLQWEIIALSNRILIADAADPADAEATYKSMRKAFQTLDLGLKYLSHEDPVKAAIVLRTVPTVTVFQTGFSLGLRLRRKAESILKRGWLSRIDRGMEIIDSPLKETMRGLLRKRPLFFCEESGGNERPFERLEEVELVEHWLERISVLGKVVHEHFGISADEINRVNPEICYLSDLPLSAICLTVLANRIVRGEGGLEPIEPAWLERLFGFFMERRPGKHRARVKPDISKRILEEFTSRGKWVSGREKRVLSWWTDFLIHRLESAMGGTRHPEDIDPQYIDVFMIRRRDSHIRI